MYLESLILASFRNYTHQELLFNPGINVFFGMNAQGKTNLLEAIYFLSVSRSFRTSQESEIIQLGSDHFYLKGTYLTKSGTFRVETGWRKPRQLQIKINGKIVRRNDYIYRHPVVIFAPDDLFLIKGGPSVRRRFLDMECSRIKPLYYGKLRDYYRALRQRNMLLKEKRASGSFNFSTMKPWDELLVEKGSWIINERIKFLKELELLAQAHFVSLTAGKEKFSLHYRSTVDFEENPALIESSFREQLAGSRTAELSKGSTMVGPHLDDFSVFINGIDTRKFGSQGQQRSTVLALKMGEVDLFNSIGDERSILLLDDVFSELDEERCRRLLQFIINRGDQSFITTAMPLPFFKKDYGEDLYYFTLSGGEVKIDRAGADH
ncbi:MAG: DNA replication/repair protein RecF [Firmicutes bacterium]|nr:DNA replication/repair protein RecF [Bacillota bacterium]